MKTAISLPDALFERAEKLANRLGLSRSQLYARALETFVERYEEEAITQKLDDVYSGESEDIDPVLFEMQLASLGEESW